MIVLDGATSQWKRAVVSSRLERGLECAESLIAQRVAKRVDLVHCLAEGVVEPAAASANGVVALS